MTTSSITYAQHDGHYVIKFVGDIRYTTCPALDDFIHELFEQKDLKDVAIDLIDAVSIDSTNLGFLAMITNAMQQRFKKKAVIYSTNEDINRTLDCICFYDVFDVIESNLQTNDGQDLIEISGSAEITASMIRETHQALSDINEGNRLMFKDVIDSLSKET